MPFLRFFSDTNAFKINSGRVATSDVNLELKPYGKHYVKLEKDGNATLFALLKKDVELGNVFPAIRNDELHFYYKGGCLFKFLNGMFYRDKNYENYSQETEGLSTYEKAKKENENKFCKSSGESKERQLLDKLYCHTFGTAFRKNVVVLDIEVNLKGNVGWGKKCDLVLLNTQTDEIMFVEGKIYSDNRVRCAVGYLPEVIEQVDIYTAAIAEQRQTILTQYAEYVSIINKLFGTEYRPPKRLIEPAKLLVYETGGGVAANTHYTVEVINERLGVNNVMWVEKGNAPTTDEIWEALCK